MNTKWNNITLSFSYHQLLWRFQGISRPILLTLKNPENQNTATVLEFSQRNKNRCTKKQNRKSSFSKYTHTWYLYSSENNLCGHWFKCHWLHFNGDYTATI